MSYIFCIFLTLITVLYLYMHFMKSYYINTARRIYAKVYEIGQVSDEEFEEYYLANAGFYFARYLNAPSISLFTNILSACGIVCVAIFLYMIYVGNYIFAIVAVIISALIFFGSTVVFYSFNVSSLRQFSERALMNYKARYPNASLFTPPINPGMDSFFCKIWDMRLEHWHEETERITRWNFEDLPK